jgi:UrcA family protein
MKLIVTSVAFVLGLGLVSVAQAQTAAGPGDAPRQVVVRYSDLNLANPAGVEALNGRVAKASQTLCGPQPYIANLNARNAYETCVIAAKASAAAATEEAVLAARSQSSQPMKTADRLSLMKRLDEIGRSEEAAGAR